MSQVTYGTPVIKVGTNTYTFPTVEYSWRYTPEYSHITYNPITRSDIYGAVAFKIELTIKGNFTNSEIDGFTTFIDSNLEYGELELKYTGSSYVKCVISDFQQNGVKRGVVREFSVTFAFKERYATIG